MLPPQFTQSSTPTLSCMTRWQSQPQHDFQLCLTIPVASRNSLLNTFPYGTIRGWNRLPPDLLRSPPNDNGLQSFKSAVNEFLLEENWLWATDHLWWSCLPLKILQHWLHFAKLVTHSHTPTYDLPYSELMHTLLVLHNLSPAPSLTDCSYVFSMCQVIVVLCLCRAVLHLSHLSPYLSISFAAFALPTSVTLFLLFSFPSLLLVRLCSVEAETCRSAELLKPHHHVLVYAATPWYTVRWLVHRTVFGTSGIL